MENTAKKSRVFGILWLVITLILSLLVLWGVSMLGRDQFTKQANKPLIVASVPHIAVWTENLVGDAAQVEVLAKGGVELHDFTLAPQDLEKVAVADIVIKNGAGLEPWLDNIEEQFPNKIFVDTTAGFDLRENDPHTWLDPILASQQITAIKNALESNIPELQIIIEQNAQAYLEEISQLDKEIKSRLAQVDNLNFISFHEAFNYFARRYGLQVVGQLVQRPGDQITLQEIQNIGLLSKQNNIHTMFIEPGPVPDQAQTIAHEFNLNLLVLDPLETLPLEPGAYIQHMQENLNTLIRGLQ